MDDKKLFLLDAYALIYRAYYALIRSPRFTSKGFNTSAVFGFCNTLNEVLQKWEPSHIAVCFDPHGPTFRHEMYSQYKATREAQPEDITLSVPIIKEIVEAYHIPVFEVPGYEADDVIGTLSRQATLQGFTTYMMTPDKDYGQLVNDHVLMFRPALGGKGEEIRDVARVCELYGVSDPDQIIDLLALEGDSIDNIPGCPGVGPKRAVQLIAEYGSVENMLDHASEIKGSLGEKVRNNAEQIRFSKDLATIRTDVPLKVDIDRLRRQPEDTDKLREIFTRLEFKTFLARLNAGITPPKDQPHPEKSRNGAAKNIAPSLFDLASETTDGRCPAQAETAETRHVRYAALETPADIAREIENCCKAPYTGIALYAPGIDAMSAPLTAIAISHAPGRGHIINLPAASQARREIISILEPLFASETTILVSHDIKRDMVLMRREGVIISAAYFDTSLAHYVLQPEMRHRLADIAMNVLNYCTADYEAPTAASRRPYGPIEPGQLTLRLCEQADVTLQLRQPLAQELEANGQTKLITDIELPLARVLADMEWTGVGIDSTELAKLSASLTERIRAIEEEIYQIAGERFNIGSPMQVGEMLFGRMQLDPKAKRTKTGAFSTTEEILEKHRHSHPIVGLILDARSLKKLLTTYVNALPEMVNRQTGKIHTTFNQTITATGRLSSANPNLQNIPVRTEDGREVRRAFIADPGCAILSADYSQIELRLLAALSNDPDLTRAFHEGLDIHRATAAKIYHLPYEDVTDTQRRNAKTANFGTIYGISAFGLAERLGIPRSEAKELIDGYFATYPHIRQYIDHAVATARQNGYVSTIMGRKRFLPDINSRNATVRNFAERNAVNAPLQGSAADIIKLAMIRIYNELNTIGMRSKMVMQVHDELIFNAPVEEIPRLQEIVVRLMEGAFSGTVPLEVSAGVGQNWLEAH